MDLAAIHVDIDLWYGNEKKSIFIWWEKLKKWGGDYFIKTNKKLALDLLSHIILKVATAFYLPWGQSNDKNKWILNL